MDELIHLLTRFSLVQFQPETGRYHVKNNHKIITNLPKTHESFPRFYMRALEQLKEKAEKDFYNEESLLFASVFSVSEKNLPEIRQRIHDAALKIIDDVEQGNGDRVKTLVLGLV